MIKEIKYNGCTANPSDYECADGDLAMALNLVNDFGHLSPIALPAKVMCLQSNERLLYIHNVAGQKNYILARNAYPDGTTPLQILWIKHSANGEPETSSNAVTMIDGVDTVNDVTAIGNTLVFALNHGLYYALWKDDSYLPLGYKPPVVSIDFAMRKVAELDDSKEFSIPVTCTPAWTRSLPSKSELAEFTQTAYGLLLSSVAERVTSAGYFYQPFFVRYAIRLYDGSYCRHSAPILMLPTIIPPLIHYADEGSTGSAENGYSPATLSLRVPFFSLNYRILADGVADLQKWGDIVAGIDIFISAPIYTYDQAKDLQGHPITNTRAFLWQVSPDKVDAGRLNSSIAENVFVGHYADPDSDDFVDHTMCTTADTDSNKDFYKCLRIMPHTDFHSNIVSEHSFYKIAEFDLKEIAEMDKLEPLQLKAPDMSSLVTRQTLPDDYQSHCNIVASSLFVYNSRLNIATAGIEPAEPFPMRPLMQYGNPKGDNDPVTNAKITVWSRHGGARSVAVHLPAQDAQADVWYSPADNFPRYIFYPDAAAYKMEIFISDNEKYIIDLKPHDFLNGAYWYSGQSGMSVSSAPPENATPENALCGNFINAQNKIYTSEVNNPFYFPVLGINTVGTGNILGICAAAKALSEGQFGQFPLYAFTTDGVWALEVSNTGTYSAKQPIARDVVINPNSITQIDNAVLFATDRGIMHISGSTVQCISDLINTEAPFTMNSIPKAEALINIFNRNVADGWTLTLDDVTLLPFSVFLKDCQMLYDYAGKRIIVYNPNVRYAYIYSLRSQSWSMMQSNIVGQVNSYSEALAVTSNAELVDFSKSENITTASLIVTRPLKMDDPNVFKTVNTVIQRGMFPFTRVRQVLYGSNDLIHWHTVWSSVDKIMRGFRGTPYKAYRLALVCMLDSSESIYGCSVVFEPRITNQLR